MKTIIQLIKRVNNTEIGAGNTNEFYVLVPTELDVSNMMNLDEECEFICRKNPTQRYKFRYTYGREKRIVGMGEFYRENSIEAGDEVILECSIDDLSNKYYVVDYKKNSKSIVLQKFKDGFELLSPSKMHLINAETKTEKGQSIEIDFVGNFKKRSDSPKETKCYIVKIDGTPISNDSSRPWLEIIVCNHVAVIKPINTWKMLKFKK